MTILLPTDYPAHLGLIAFNGQGVFHDIFLMNVLLQPLKKRPAKNWGLDSNIANYNTNARVRESFEDLFHRSFKVVCM